MSKSAKGKEMTTTLIRLLAIVRLFMGAAAILTPYVTSAAGDQSKVQLTISAENDTGTVADPPVVSITFVNLSQSTLSVLETNEYREYELSCVDERGSPVPLTKFGQNVHGPGPFGRRFMKEIAPGGKSVDRLDLGKVFSFSKPGAYKVSAKRDYYTAEPAVHLGVVVSNWFSFKLTN